MAFQHGFTNGFLRITQYHVSGLLVLSLMLFAVPLGLIANPNVYYVSQHATPAEPWDQWSNAFTNLQDAINAADAGDIIYVAGQTFDLTESLNWIAKDGLKIIGGFEAADDSQSPGSPDPAFWPTVLRRGTSARFRILDVEDVTGGTISNITFRGGYPANNEYGGGLKIVDSSLLLTHCVIEQNRTYRYDREVPGGGVYAAGSDLVIEHSLIRDNFSSMGYAATSRYTEGGGLFFSGGSSELRNTIVRGNRAAKTTHEAFLNRAGGLGYVGGTHLIENCLVAGNAVSGVGSAIWVDNASTELVILNSTVAGNTGGTALHVDAGTVAVTNSIFWQNEGDIGGNGTVTLAYSNTEDGFDASQNGNISSDPQFERGFYLRAGSPSENAGTGSPADWGVDGLTTRADGTVDSGVVNQGYHFSAGLDMSVADLYVATSGNDGNSGEDWGNAFATLTHALSIARDGTRIHIGEGVFDNGGDHQESFPLEIIDRWGLQLLGAGAADSTLAVVGSTRQRLLNVERIAGDSLIRGLTFTGGAPPNNQQGAAWYLHYGVLTIEDCRIEDNKARGNDSSFYGGGIYVREALTTLSNVHFVANLSENYYTIAQRHARAGGAYFYRGRSQIDHSVFTQNRAYKINPENFESQGGGVYYRGGEHLMRNSLVVSNEATGVGSAFVIDGATVTLENVTVADNQGSVALVGSSQLTVWNCIFWGHEEGDFTGMAEEAFYYSTATGLTAGVQGNLNVDPLFVGDGDYRLQTSLSPAIDAGTNMTWMTGTTDLAGQDRLQRGRRALNVDMGAYETSPPDDTGLFLIALDAENVVADQADMTALLTGTGNAENPSIYLCWGPVDGGTSTTGGWAKALALGDAWDAPGVISYTLSSLTPGANVEARFFASNSDRDFWTDLVTFTTVGTSEVVDDGVAWVRYRQASLSGTVTDDGGQAVTVWLQYWPASMVSTSVVPVGIVGEGESFVVIPDGLSMDTEYVYRWVASNVSATVMSPENTFTTLTADPVVWYVASEGSATSATAWDSAFQTVHDAIAVAESGDIIYVAGEEFLFEDEIVLTLSGLTVIGGFEPGVGEPGVSDPEQWPTVFRRVGDPLIKSDPRTRFFNISGVSGLVLDSLTMQGGFPSENSSGGAIYVENSTDIVIQNCVFLDNLVYTYYRPHVRGGAVFATDSTGILSNVVFSGNASFNGYASSSERSDGGAVALEGGGWLLRDTVFRANLARKVRGNIYGSTGSSLIETYINRGGALFLDGGFHRLENSIIAGNASIGEGSAIWVDNASTELVILNSTVAGNTGGTALYVDAGTVAVTNSIFWQNEGDIGGNGTVTLAYSNTEDGFDASQNGNISSDPQFERGFYLRAGSPSENAGTGSPADWGVDGLTTRADGTADSGVVNQGYHFSAGLDMAVADLYVAVYGDDANSGVDGYNALATVSHAVSLAQDGTRIHIGSGAFDNIGEAVEQYPLSFQRLWGIQLLGSGATNSTLAVKNGERVRLINMDYVVGDALVQGITMTGGYPPSNQDGGAVNLNYSIVRFEDCAFIDNQAQNTLNTSRPLGGALYAEESTVLLKQVAFRDNRAWNSYGSTASGRSRGGGAYFFRGRSHLDRVTFIGNISDKSSSENFESLGGAIHYRLGNHALFNTLVVSNTASGDGSAISVNGAMVSLNNVTVADNFDTVALLGDADVSVTNSIFWNHTGGDFDNLDANVFFYSTATGLTAGVQGNLNVDPLFVGGGDYRLQQGISPPFNAGTNLSWMAGATDLDGNRRIAFSIVDMGAYEIPPASGSLFLIR